MSDRAREAEGGGGRLRCPFCHDALAEADPALVACAKCGAPHHASCLVESGGCAATGCGSYRAVAGGREVDVDDLRSVVADGDLPASLAARAGLSGLVIAVLVVAWALVPAALLAVDAALGLAGFAVVTLAVMAAWALFARRGHRNLRDPRQERELLGSIGVILPEPITPRLIEQLAGSGPPPDAPAGPRPSHCPACRAALDDEAAADDECERAWFCHHCGASLLPEAPKGDD